MKKFTTAAVGGLVLLMILIGISTGTTGAPTLTYVYSDSMVPLIQVNDGFLVWPEKEPQVGDIVMYRPMVLDAPFITHRIVEIGANGFITKGDNSPYNDQTSGEPEVTLDRIVGKVVGIQGQPLTIPGLGKLASTIQERTGDSVKYLSAGFFALAALNTFFASRAKRRKKPHHRLRLRDAYRITAILIVLVIVSSVYFGARVTKVPYLVSERPGTRGDMVKVNRPGELTVAVVNNGAVPTWSFTTGIPPLQVKEAPESVLPRSKSQLVLGVAPQSKTGVYQGYVQTYNYPILMPRSWVSTLHQLHPMAAILATGGAAGLYLALLIRILDRIPGLEGWVPLKAIRDKYMDRRIQRARAKILGRRRMRTQ